MKPTLLIAEDDVELCELYQRFFTQRGYDVETAADGLDCQALLLRLTPSVVILDLELRWGGGDGVLAWLREERGLLDVPVILTATAGYTVTAQDTGPPVVKVLTKPFALTALLESVRAATAVKRETTPDFQLAGLGPELYLG